MEELANNNRDNNDVEDSKPKEDDIADLPTKLLWQMKEYAKNLRKKHPKMKPERVQELTAKKFNIKLL